MILLDKHLDIVLSDFDKILSQKKDQHNISFLNGLTGAAVTSFYLGRYHDPVFTQKAVQLVDIIHHRLQTYAFNLKPFHSYCAGMAGVINAFRHLNDFGFYPNDIASSFTPFNELLLRGVSQDFRRKNTDFLHGPLGVFYQFLFRMDEPGTQGALQQIFNQYKASLKLDERGARIFNSVILDQKEKEYNLGLAHGLAGHLLIFAEAYQRSWAREEVAHILREGIRYIRSLERAPGPNDYPTYFPCYNIESPSFKGKEVEEAFDTRLAWCYGDLDIALALIKVGEVLEESEMQEAGIQLAIKTTSRKTPDESKVEWNPFFCHGSSGLAYIYQVLSARTSRPEFEAAHQYWIGRTNEILDEIFIKEGDQYALSVLEGYSGLALVMLAHHQKDPLAFKELLLLNL